jgi:polysaccharide biosynthesis transport protein
MPTKEQDRPSLNHLNSTQTQPYWIKRIPDRDEESSGLAQILTVLSRRAAVIVSVAALAAAGAYALSSRQKPQYDGKFQLLVEPLKTADSQLLVLLSETLKQNVNEITRQNTTTLDYQALMEVLKSPKIINPVIEKLSPRYPDITYGSLIGYTGMPKGSEQLQIVRIAKGKDESRVIEINYKGSNPEKVQAVLTEVANSYQKYSQQEQQTNLRQGIKFIDSQVPIMKLRVDKLQKELQNFQQKHNLYNPQLQGEQILKRAEDLQQQQRETVQKLAEARSLYDSLKQQVGLPQNVAIAASALNESEQYQQIRTKVQDIDAKIATESARFKEGSPVIETLREQRAKLIPLLNREAQIAFGGGGTKDAPVSSAQAFANGGTVRRELTQQLANVTNQIKSHEASLLTVNQSIQQVNQLIQEFPALTRNYNDIQRNLQVATDTLTQILSKQEALRVNREQEEVPWELIMPPTIARDKNGTFMPIAKSATRDASLGGGAGLLLGVILAFALDNMKSIIYKTEELKRSTKLPLLGVIPFNKEVKRFSGASDVLNLVQKQDNGTFNRSFQGKTPAFMEAFSSLFARVQFLKAEDKLSSISVSSATDKVGKSTVAVYLAQAAAEAGQRVLLVDSDLRNPQVHLRLGMTNTQGLSEVLSQNLDLSEAIQPSPSDKNLYVLTSGQPPSNPIKLLSSKRMQALVERLPNNFDLVIYDTPHLLGPLDGNLVATHTDGMVMVIGLGKTDRPGLKQALDESKAARIPVIGIVANAVKR